MPFFSSFTGSFKAGRRKPISIGVGGGGGGGAATYSLDGATQSATTQLPGGALVYLNYNADGTEVTTTYNLSKQLYTVALPTPYDPTSGVANYDSGDPNEVINITAGSLAGFRYNNDGTKAFFTHQYANSSPSLVSGHISEFPLGTAYDIFSISSSPNALYDVTGDWYGSNSFNITDINFNTDGSKMFITNAGGLSALGIFEYDLGTEFDLSTATYSQGFDFATDMPADILPRFGTFNSAGTKFYMADIREKYVYEFDLSTGFDVSTMSYNGVFLDISGIDTGLRQVGLSQDETQLYVTGAQNRRIYTFDLVQDAGFGGGGGGGIGAISSLSFVRSGASGATNPYQLKMSSDGTIATWAISGIGAGSDQYTLSTAWDFSTATKTVSNSTKIIPSGHDANYTSNQMAFSNDGNSLYVNAGASGGTTRSIYQYNMSTPWTLSTASYASKSFIFTHGTVIGDLIFNNDGSKMYIPRRISGTEFYQYSLSSAYDISTATDDGVTFDPGVDLNGLAFNADGTYLYAIYDPGDTNYIKQWSLSTPYDLSTATAGTDVLLGDATTEAAPTGLAFGNDQLHVSGQQFDNVRTYDIS